MIYFLIEIFFNFPYQIGDEAMQCRTDAALFDISYYGKFYLTGPDAQKAANLIFTSDLEHAQSEYVLLTWKYIDFN